MSIKNKLNLPVSTTLVHSIELVWSKVVGSSSSRYRDRSVGSTKFAHTGKFKNHGINEIDIVDYA